MYLSISKKILAWYKKYQRDLPWRKFKSQKDRHYKVLLSEYMLQQTQVKTAIPYFNNFYKNINTIQKLSKTHQSKVNKLWEGLGYYRRAKFLLETSRIISKKYNSKLPMNYDDLIKLPGIGDYTAKALLSIGHDKSEIGIDGNVSRVVSRLFLVKDKKKIQYYVNKLKVKKNPSSLMQGIMELGALICKPKNPLCIDCYLKDDCKFKYNTFKNFKSSKNTSQKIRKLIACIYIKNTKILLTRKNDFGPLNGFLNVPIIEKDHDNTQTKLKNFFGKDVKYSFFCKINTSISNFKAEISCIKIKNCKKIHNHLNFYTFKQLQNNFKSSFLIKILKKTKFII
ncbi:MAG: hypothetical protein CMI73_02190 [Candidatus Pelagibacter sp.]|nr:hypothetical protein [Candidatus Pelagibacter sp.]OUV87704.1 MAG: hypothetical protein CBC96_01590 [Pelagibacteraceae bacterium TMED136]|tara:strand:+ start:32435 stop:33451 length:1017 start_codon:yes stop_codon:yes gene_type:complete